MIDVKKIEPFFPEFDVVTPVFHPPPGTLLSMKIKAFLNRRKTRDCFDIMNLFSLTNPDFEFLKDKLHIANKKALKEKMLERCEEFNFKQQVNDSRPYLFNGRDAEKIMLFPNYLKEVLK